jgi:hypothetical protein
MLKQIIILNNICIKIYIRQMVYKSQKRQLYGDEENITLNKHITILSHIKKSCEGYNKIWHKIIKNMNLILNKFCHIYLFDGILHGSSKIKRIVLLSEFILWLFLFHEMLWFVELFPEHHVAILNFSLFLSESEEKKLMIQVCSHACRMKRVQMLEILLQASKRYGLTGDDLSYLA